MVCEELNMDFIYLQRYSTHILKQGIPFMCKAPPSPLSVIIITQHDIKIPLESLGEGKFSSALRVFMWQLLHVRCYFYDFISLIQSRM